MLGLGACNRSGTDPANQELGSGDGNAPVPVGREESATARAGTAAGTMGMTPTGTPGTTGLNDTGTTTASGGGSTTGAAGASGRATTGGTGSR